MDEKALKTAVADGLREFEQRLGPVLEKLKDRQEDLNLRAVSLEEAFRQGFTALGEILDAKALGTTPAVAAELKALIQHVNERLDRLEQTLGGGTGRSSRANGAAFVGAGLTLVERVAASASAFFAPPSQRPGVRHRLRPEHGAEHGAEESFGPGEM